MNSTQVTILMGVYCGADALPAQLRSFVDQSHRAWQVIAQDDSPDQSSARILADFAQTHPLTLRRGPQQGFAANYMQMIRSLPVCAGMVAFADQDDIWLADKLARAVAALQGLEAPALYCARSYYWDGVHKTPSPKRRRAPSLRNALIENIAQGNTIVLNAQAAALARTASQAVDAVFAHDWWLYQLISGAGGRVIMDNGPPVMLYRQHAQNLIGAGTGMTAQMGRKLQVLRGAFAQRVDLNIAALQGCGDMLTPQARDTLARFAQARARRLPGRLAGLARVAPYRQTLGGSLGFWGAAVLGRV